MSYLLGNLIIGKESADRWQKLSYPERKKSSFLDLAEQSIHDQPVGSSAGGDRPKFSVVLSQKHYLVKFAGPLRNPVQRRWGDLLYCEALANEVLSQSDLPCAKTQIWESDDFIFLLAERFDRIGLKGRRSYLSLAAVDDLLFGQRDNWAASAQRLNRSGLLSNSHLKQIQLCDAFARLIGDSDRHFYNLGLFPQFKSEAHLLPESYELAPVFDKLPMLFSPVEGRIIEREFNVELPGIELITAWNQAKELAQIFWQCASQEASISAGFRQIAKTCLKAIRL